MDDEDYQEGDFLKKKMVLRFMKEEETIGVRKEPCGVCEKKKNDLITNLCRFMPRNRHDIGKGLPTSQTSTDLLEYD